MKDDFIHTLTPGPGPWNHDLPAAEEHLQTAYSVFCALVLHGALGGNFGSM